MIHVRIKAITLTVLIHLSEKKKTTLETLAGSPCPEVWFQWQTLSTGLQFQPPCPATHTPYLYITKGRFIAIPLTQSLLDFKNHSEYYITKQFEAECGSHCNPSPWDASVELLSSKSALITQARLSRSVKSHLHPAWDGVGCREGEQFEEAEHL